MASCNFQLLFNVYTKESVQQDVNKAKDVTHFVINKYSKQH